MKPGRYSVACYASIQTGWERVDRLPGTDSTSRTLIPNLAPAHRHLARSSSQRRSSPAKNFYASTTCAARQRVKVDDLNTHVAALAKELKLPSAKTISGPTPGKQDKPSAASPKIVRPDHDRVWGCKAARFLFMDEPALTPPKKKAVALNETTEQQVRAEVDCRRLDDDRVMSLCKIVFTNIFQRLWNLHGWAQRVLASKFVQ